MIEDLNLLIPSSQECASFDKREQKQKFVEKNNEILPWLWNGSPIDQIPKQHQTFVYLITNKITKKQYIGYKTAVSFKTSIVGGKKKRKKIQSDWKKYFSSSKELLADVALYGKGNFIREIIAFTVNRSVGKYIQAYFQFTRNVLTTRKDFYYNGIVNLRINHSSLAKFNNVVFADTIIGDNIQILSDNDLKNSSKD